MEGMDGEALNIIICFLETDNIEHLFSFFFLILSLFSACRFSPFSIVFMGDSETVSFTVIEKFINQKDG